MENFARLESFLASQWKVAPVEEGALDTNIDSIYRAVTSGKWRRSKMDRYSENDTREKIQVALDLKNDIEFSVPFGGYKSYRFPSYPHVNWADVFAVNHLRKYGVFVKRSYPYPVKISFSYCSGVLNKVNNMPLQDQETYLGEFEKLIDMFSDSQVQFSLYDVASAYGSLGAVLDELEKNYIRIEEQWAYMPNEHLEKRLASAERNLQISGVEDLTSLNNSSLAERIKRSAIYCEALDNLKQRRSFNKFSSRIQLVNIRGPQPSIHISSCETSANHFSVGEGVVERRSNRYLQRIITSRLFNSDLSKGKIKKLATDRELSKGFLGLKHCFYTAYEN